MDNPNTYVPHIYIYILFCIISRTLVHTRTDSCMSYMCKSTHLNVMLDCLLDLIAKSAMAEGNEQMEEKSREKKYQRMKK